MKDGGPAFPRPISNGQLLIAGDVKNVEIRPQGGMSLRDYFASLSMLGRIITSVETPEVWKTMPRNSYRDADAMLAEREKEPNSSQT